MYGSSVPGQYAMRKPRLLVIRGGAIGDFILTLPALAALRQALPQAHIEILGNPHRAILALHPAYADRITDLESWDVYRLFSPQTRVSERLAAYLGSFAAIFTYLPEAAMGFAARLRQYCPGYVVSWPPQPPAGLHVTDHLLQPVRDFRPQTYDPTPRVYLPAAAREAAAQFWHAAGLPDDGVVALHPGSGGSHKLWPVAGWEQVMRWAARQGVPCIVMSGPADHERVARLMRRANLPPWPCAGEMPLLHLAAIAARCQVVVGHDSGVTHLAAAVGSTTLALFGPTDPYMWGPRSPRACILQPRRPGPLTLNNLPPAMVIQTLEALWRGTFPFTPCRLACTICSVSE
jgi:heptosyltransferase-3